MNLTLGKSLAEAEPVSFGQGHNQQAAGILVQAMHNTWSLSFNLTKLWKTCKQSLHQRLFRAGGAGVYGEARGFVANHQVLVMPEHFQFPVFRRKLARYFRQLEHDHLPCFHLGCRFGFGLVIHRAVAGLNGFLQSRPRHVRLCGAQYAVKPLARLSGCDFQLQAVHWSVSAGVESVRSLSTKVVPL